MDPKEMISVEDWMASEIDSRKEPLTAPYLLFGQPVVANILREILDRFNELIVA